MKNWIKIFSTALFMLALGFSVMAGEPDQAKVNLNVKGMKCGGCEAKVKNILKDIEGVVSTEEVSSEKGAVAITIDKSKISESAVASALADKSGYDVTVVSNGVQTKGNPKAACCVKGQTKAACENKDK